MNQINEKTIRRALELVSFSGADISIVTGAKKTLRGTVVDVDGPQIHFQVDSPNLDTNELVSGFNVIFGFKKSAITFSTKPLEVRGNVIVASEVTQAKSVDYREKARASLVNPTVDLSASFVSGDIDASEFVTRELMDINDEAVALFVDRSQGLLLPGDEIKNLNISAAGKTVIS